MLGGIAFQLGTPPPIPRLRWIHTNALYLLPAVITVYAAFASDFLFRYLKDRPYSRTTRKETIESQQSSIELQAGYPVERPSGRGIFTPRLKLMLAGLAFSALVLYIRYISRFSLLV